METHTDTRSFGTLVELTVRNHPGVMSHITNLFARRAVNVEGILVLPDNAQTSTVRLWLLDNARLEQILGQLADLYDVESAAARPLSSPFAEEVGVR